MIFKQKLKAGEMFELGAGKYIKIINSQTDLRLRVFGVDGSIKSNTVVRSGFELTFSEFKYATVQTEVDQPFEIWCSFDPLGYDAPSSNANTMQSYKANHFGDTDPILPFEPNRLTARIVSDAPWWYGGGNVDKENGIPVAAGEIAEVRGAAEISAAISAQGEYVPTADYLRYTGNIFSYFSINTDMGVINASSGGSKKINLLTEGEVETHEPEGAQDTIGNICYLGGGDVMYVTQYERRVLFKYNLNSRQEVSFSLKNIGLSDGFNLSQVNNMVDAGDNKLIAMVNITEYETDVQYHALALIDLNEQTINYRLAKQGSNLWARTILRLGDSFVSLDSTGIRLFGIDEFLNLPILMSDYSGEYLTGAVQGSHSYAMVSGVDEKGNYLITVPSSSTGGYAVINPQTKWAITGYADCGAISAAGLILYESHKIKISYDLGFSFTTLVDVPSSRKGDYMRMYYIKNNLYTTSSDEESWLYLTYKKRVNVKQTFRVLKAYS